MNKASLGYLAKPCLKKTKPKKPSLLCHLSQVCPQGYPSLLNGYHHRIEPSGLTVLGAASFSWRQTHGSLTRLGGIFPEALSDQR